MKTTFIFAIGITPVIFFIAGILIGYRSHPYETCRHKYVEDDYVGECVWLKLKSRSEKWDIIREGRDGSGYSASMDTHLTTTVDM